ncbi:MAG: T9SS type A sorting domain-containing protein, partial [Bacteroidota bacterium]
QNLREIRFVKIRNREIGVFVRDSSRSVNVICSLLNDNNKAILIEPEVRNFTCSRSILVNNQVGIVNLSPVQTVGYKNFWGSSNSSSISVSGPVLTTPFFTSASQTCFDPQGGTHRKSQDITDIDLQVSPNPAVDFSQISFSLREEQAVSIQLLDMNGKIVRTIMDKQHFSGGQHRLKFNTKPFGSGIYLIRLATSEEVEIQKIQIL